MDVLVMDRGMGKTTRMVEDIFNQQTSDPQGQIVVLVPNTNYATWLLPLMHNKGINTRRVTVMTPTMAGWGLRGMRGTVYAEDLDHWREGIYDPVFKHHSIRLVTATPIPTETINLPKPPRKRRKLSHRQTVIDYVFQQQLAGTIDSGAAAHLMKLIRGSNL